MFNTLFTLRFGGRELAFHSYGILIAVGLAAGIALAYREGRRRGFDHRRLRLHPLPLQRWRVDGRVGPDDDRFSLRPIRHRRCHRPVRVRQRRRDVF